MRRSKYIVITLFLVGVFHWLAFFYLTHPIGGESAFILNLKSPSSFLISETFTAHDWYKEIEYQKVIKDVLTQRELPFHVPELGKLFMVKERFLGAPIWTMSPQIVLLRWLDPMTFTVVNVLLMYTVGFLGLLLIRKHFNLGISAFTLLFLIFNFNGYFIGKISAYGPAQLGYFLIPFVLLMIFKASRPGQDDSAKNEVYQGLLLGLALAGVLWQGSLHLFVEWLTFVLIWGIICFRKWRFTISALISVCAIGAVRILPAAITFGASTTHHSVIAHGYSLRQPWIFLQALGSTTTHISQPYPFGWWEFSAYVSWVGLILVIAFGIWPYMRAKSQVQSFDWRTLWFPTLYLFVASFGPLKRFLIPNFIPLLNGESLTSRYMIIPLLFVTVIAAVNMNGFLRNTKRRVLSITVISGLLLVMAGFLFNHSRLWRMHLVQNQYDWVVANRIFGELPSEPVMLTIKNHSGDTFYMASFWVGLAVSLISLAVVVWWVWRINHLAKDLPK